MICKVMIYKEVVKDLFTVSDDYYLAHCISADYALGAGIAVEFDKRFDMRRKLKEDAPNYWETMKHYNIKGECILIDRVLNLITKEKYYHKPTYESLKQSLEMMKLVCEANHIKKVAMPTIGCGLDKLEWSKVSEIIKDVFKDADIDILVCKK